MSPNEGSNASCEMDGTTSGNQSAQDNDETMDKFPDRPHLSAHPAREKAPENEHPFPQLASSDDPRATQYLATATASRPAWATTPVPPAQTLPVGPNNATMVKPAASGSTSYAMSPPACLPPLRANLPASIVPSQALNAFTRTARQPLPEDALMLRRHSSPVLPSPAPTDEPSPSGPNPQVNSCGQTEGSLTRPPVPSGQRPGENARPPTQTSGQATTYLRAPGKNGTAPYEPSDVLEQLESLKKIPKAMINQLRRNMMTYVLQCGGWNGLQVEVDRPRLQIILRATELGDGFFLLVHQLFCIWSLSKFNGARLLGFSEEQTNKSFDSLQKVIRKTTSLSFVNLQWLASYPIRGLYKSTCLPPSASALLDAARNFLTQFPESWDHACNAVMARRFPLLSIEMATELLVISPTVQAFMFTASRISLGVGNDQFGRAIEDLATKDRETRYDDDSEKRQWLISMYKTIVLKATMQRQLAMTYQITGAPQPVRAQISATTAVSVSSSSVNDDGNPSPHQPQQTSQNSTPQPPPQNTNPQADSAMNGNGCKRRFSRPLSSGLLAGYQHQNSGSAAPTYPWPVNSQAAPYAEPQQQAPPHHGVPLHVSHPAHQIHRRFTTQGSSHPDAPSQFYAAQHQVRPGYTMQGQNFHPQHHPQQGMPQPMGQYPVQHLPASHLQQPSRKNFPHPSSQHNLPRLSIPYPIMQHQNTAHPSMPNMPPQIMTQLNPPQLQSSSSLAAPQQFQAQHQAQHQAQYTGPSPQLPPKQPVTGRHPLPINRPSSSSTASWSQQVTAPTVPPSPLTRQLPQQFHEHVRIQSAALQQPQAQPKRTILPQPGSFPQAEVRAQNEPRPRPTTEYMPQVQVQAKPGGQPQPGSQVTAPPPAASELQQHQSHAPVPPSSLARPLTASISRPESSQSSASRKRPAPESQPTPEPFIPRPGREIPRKAYPQNQYDRRCFINSLHQHLVASPPRRPMSLPALGTEEQWFQFVQDLVVGPVRLDHKCVIQAFHFNITPEVYSQLVRYDPRRPDSVIPICRYFKGCHRFRLRLVRSPTEQALPSQSEWVGMPHTWPDSIFIEVNGEYAQLRRAQHHSRHLPFELTPHIVEGRNVVNLVMKYEPQTLEGPSDIILAIEDITTVSGDDLRERIIANDHVSVEDSAGRIINRIKASANQDDVKAVSSDLSVRITDPFSSKPCVVPVRGVECKHTECFDLDNWLGTRVKKGGWWNRFPDPHLEPSLVDKWACPLCSGDARPQSLRVDDLMVQIGKNLDELNHGNVSDVLFSSNGSWTPVKPEDADDKEEADMPGKRRKQNLSRLFASTPEPMSSTSTPTHKSSIVKPDSFPSSGVILID